VDLSQIEFLCPDEDSGTNMGLPQDTYEVLSKEIDAVVDYSFWKPSQIKSEDPMSIRSEADRMKQLFEFAGKEKRKFVYHAETLLPQSKGSVNLILGENLPSRNIDELQKYTNGGYSSRQFVSECLINQAIERGLSCKVFRLPYLSGDSRTGRFELDEGHIFLRFLNFMRIGKMPIVDVPFAVLPVDVCASLTLRVFLDLGSSTPNTIYNLTNPHNYSYKDFFQVSEELGRPLRAVEMEDFLADKNTIVDTISDTYGNPLEHDNVYAKLADTDEPQVITYTNIMEVVDDFMGQVETPVQILKRDLKYASDSGLFQHFVNTAEGTSN